MSPSGFGRFVRAWRGHAIASEIGRTKRVEPLVAVALLEARGIPEHLAQDQVRRLVESRKSAFPIFDSADDAELLVEMSRRYQIMVERMQQPEFGRGMRRIFGSTGTEELRRAAARSQARPATDERLHA